MSPLRDGQAGRIALRFTAPPAESVGWTQISEGRDLRRPNFQPQENPARRSRNRSSADFQVGCVAGFPTRCPYGCRWSCRLGSRRHSRFGNLRYEVRRSLSGKSSRLVTILTDSSTKKRSTLNFQSLAGSKRSEDRSLPTSYIQINPPSSGHCPCWPLDWPGDRAQWPCPDRRTRPSPCRETGNCRVCHPD